MNEFLSFVNDAFIYKRVLEILLFPLFWYIYIPSVQLYLVWESVFFRSLYLYEKCYLIYLYLYEISMKWNILSTFACFFISLSCSRYFPFSFFSFLRKNVSMIALEWSCLLASIMKIKMQNCTQSICFFFFHLGLLKFSEEFRK